MKIWKSVKKYPPKDFDLILLFKQGQYGIGYFRNGVQMDKGSIADWIADFWIELPTAPNTLGKRKNFKD